jgi:hypothetical protein
VRALNADPFQNALGLAEADIAVVEHDGKLNDERIGAGWSVTSSQPASSHRSPKLTTPIEEALGIYVQAEVRGWRNQRR